MRRLLLIVAIVALVASCTSDGGEPAEASSHGALPLDAVLIDVLGTDDIGRYRWDIERDAERLLIECMQAAGFEFIVPSPLPPGATDAEIESREFAASHGFGIIDDFRAWLDDTDFEALQGDPNGAFLRTLTGAEISRYLLVLDGEAAEPGQLPENAGCRGSASDEAYATWNSFLDLLPNYAAIAEERDTHPEWLAARSDWSECMAELGYDYAEPEAIRSDVEQRMSETVQSVYPDGRVPLVQENGRFVLDPVVEPLLEELKAFEVAAATANHDCTEPLADRFEAVELEVQQGFVDRNQEAINELRQITG